MGHYDLKGQIWLLQPDLITYQYPYCYRQSCLHIAAKTGDLTAMHFLIKNGAHLDAKDVRL
jgi:hypothetical protein